MLAEIKDLPNYRYDTETGAIVSQLRRKTRMKVSRQQGRNQLGMLMVKDGKKIFISYNRLMYAIEHGISYFDIPQEFCILDEDGGLKVVDKQQMMERTRNAQQRQGVKVLGLIDHKIRELQIIRNAMVTGEHEEVLQYIEDMRGTLIRSHAKKYKCSRKTAEMEYCMAVERIIERLDNKTTLTDLTVNMIGTMHKIRNRAKRERPMLLKCETASNCIIKKK